MFLWIKRITIGTSKLADKEENNDEVSRTSSNNKMEENLEQEPEVPRREIGVLLRSLHEDDVDGPIETLNPEDTVGDAKRKLGLQGRRLVFRATPLDDAKTLEESGVREGATLYATPADTVELQVKTITGKSLAMRFNITDSVAVLRERIESVLGVEGRHQALLLRGTELEDARTLRESGVKNGDVIHVVMRFRGGEGYLWMSVPVCRPLSDIQEIHSNERDVTIAAFDGKAKQNSNFYSAWLTWARSICIFCWKDSRGL